MFPQQNIGRFFANFAAIQYLFNIKNDANWRSKASEGNRGECDLDAALLFCAKNTDWQIQTLEWKRDALFQHLSQHSPFRRRRRPDAQ